MMPTVDQALETNATWLNSALKVGLEVISNVQTVTFTKYQRTVLPLDGYVFWVKKSPVESFTVKGSLHYATDTQQGAEENFGLNSMVFTSEEEIENLNAVAPDELWIADYGDFKFTFSSRGSFYIQAKLYHYRGQAVFPDMSPQVVDHGTDLHVDRVIVSNSLPLWLALNAYAPPVPTRFACPTTLYPAFLTPENMVPPYGAVDIRDETTAGIAAAPLFNATMSRDQLVSETVKVTLWGLRNAEALTFIDCVNQYSLDYDLFGIMNIPVIRDEKRIQSELSTLGQKKSVVFEINYYQSVARNIARQLIEQVQATFIVQP